MHLPLVEMQTGDEVVTQGGSSGGVWILISGALQVFKGDVAVNTITKAGAIVGEMSVLLDTDHGATVVATEPSTLRYAHDGHAFLFGDQQITKLIAIGLAERLNFVSTYLADLKDQYADTTGLSMVSRSFRTWRTDKSWRPGRVRRGSPIPTTDRGARLPGQKTVRPGATVSLRSTDSVPMMDLHVAR